MIFRHHVPDSPLAEFIEFFWFYEGFYPLHRREHVLPDGTFELVIDLRDQPRKLFNRYDSPRCDSFRRGWFSGTHSEYIVIDALPNSSMIGAHFKPGGATPFLGRPADELRDQVVELDAIWDTNAWDLRDQLLVARNPSAKFDLLERFLLDRLQHSTPEPNGRTRVQWAIQHLLRQPHQMTIAGVADQSGISHKHFIEEFRRHVGLTPKLFCRIRRFQQVLFVINRRRSVEWADVAYGCGYFDQSHFVHDFQTFAGLNPSTYISHQLEAPRFVPVVE
jgi:AraC-like DNA-binding protein